MEIPFALETWSLTSWNECQFPAWFREDSVQQGNHAAENAYPNEGCGFFVQNGTHVLLHTFTGSSSPWWCSAAPDDVIRFAYWIEETNRPILASFHTHPMGGLAPSVRDNMFSMWAKIHLIWIKQYASWDFRIFQS